MEDLLRPIYQERASHPDTLGVLIIEKSKPVSPVTDQFDVILLIVVSKAEQPWFVKHYEFDGKTAAMHIVEEKVLKNWIDTGTYRRGIEWIINGRTLFDRNEYIATLKEQLSNFPGEKRKLKQAIEFSKLTRSYSESKALFESNQHLDAFSSILRSLHYLARLAVIENGFHPEVTVWNQVRRIDPEVYKLYDELIKSDEEIDKRVELMLLAVEFALSSRAASSSRHLVDIMDKKEEPWTFGELKNLDETRPYAFDLSSMVAYLTEKDMIEVIQVETKGKNIYHRQYKAK